MAPSGEMATFCGGPTIELGTGISATTRACPDCMSMTVTVSGGAFGIGVLTPCTNRDFGVVGGDDDLRAAYRQDKTALHNAAQARTRQQEVTGRKCVCMRFVILASSDGRVVVMSSWYALARPFEPGTPVYTWCAGQLGLPALLEEGTMSRQHSWHAHLRRFAFTSLLLLGVATSAFAQFDRGTITGTVKDAQGGIVPGVTVTLTSTQTQQSARPSPTAAASTHFRT